MQNQNNMAKSKPKPRRDTRMAPPAGITKGGRRHGCGGKVKKCK